MHGELPLPGPQLDLSRHVLVVGMHRIDAQVAADPVQRELGLMYRRYMPKNEGMLFVFERPTIQCFWMRNTVLPLTVAFVAEDGTIVQFADMEPLSNRSHCSRVAVRYVLEMHQGWFAQRGIREGMRIHGGPFDP